MKLDEILNELKKHGIEIHPSAIITEPDHSRDILLKYEEVNQQNTFEIIKGNYRLSSDPECIQEWKDCYERFIEFGGLESEINSIKK